MKSLVAVLSGVAGAVTAGLILFLSPFAWHLPEAEFDIHKVVWSGWQEEAVTLGASLAPASHEGLMRRFV